MLAIEIDGRSHDYKYEQDFFRQQSIETFGITLIRFEDVRVKRDVEDVLRKLEWQVSELENRLD